MGKTGLTVSTDQIHDLKAALDEHAMVAISDPQGKIACVNDEIAAVAKHSPGISSLKNK